MIEKLKSSLISQKYSVAVITPYRSQVRRIKQALSHLVTQKNNVNLNSGGSSSSSCVGRTDRRTTESGTDVSQANKKQRSEGCRGSDEKESSGKGVPIEEGEECETSASLEFDCEVNSIDGFQVR